MAREKLKTPNGKAEIECNDDNAVYLKTLGYKPIEIAKPKEVKNG